jgi:NAD(P)-dependent dehydrogenase (short-subunit alcohol dehydrogenase family)
VSGSVIHTTSASGFIGNFGQANYAAAKMGVIGLSRVVALEMRRFGVRSNVVGPVALTRMGQAGDGDDVTPELRERFDPANVSPLVAWLAAANCPANDQVFHVYADRVVVLEMPCVANDLRLGRRWTLADLDRYLPQQLASTPQLEFFTR